MRYDSFDQYVLAALAGCAAMPGEDGHGALSFDGLAERAVGLAERAARLVCEKAGHSYHGEGERRRCLRCLEPPVKQWCASFTDVAKAVVEAHAEATIPAVAPTLADWAREEAHAAAIARSLEPIVQCSGCGGQCESCRKNICAAHVPPPCDGWELVPSSNIVGQGTWVHMPRTYYGG